MWAKYPGPTYKEEVILYVDAVIFTMMNMLRPTMMILRLWRLILQTMMMTKLFRWLTIVSAIRTAAMEGLRSNQKKHFFPIIFTILFNTLCSPNKPDPGPSTSPKPRGPKGNGDDDKKNDGNFQNPSFCVTIVALMTLLLIQK